MKYPKTVSRITFNQVLNLIGKIPSRHIEFLEEREKFDLVQEFVLLEAVGGRMEEDSEVLDIREQFDKNWYSIQINDCEVVWHRSSYRDEEHTVHLTLIDGGFRWATMNSDDKDFVAIGKYLECIHLLKCEYHRSAEEIRGECARRAKQMDIKKNTESIDDAIAEVRKKVF